MRSILILAALVGLAAGGSMAATLPVETYTLPNGLTVILHEDHSQPMVTINTWFAVGSKDESPGRTGFAHLFEHLMFMGTERVPDNQFDMLMERGGGANNASTSNDRTNYYSWGPRSLLPTLLWLDADRLEGLSRAMTQEKLDLQRNVVRNERRQSYENQPYGAAELMVSDAMWPQGHPYHHPVIGSHEDLEAATVEDVKGFFDTYYVPGNASLVVAGLKGLRKGPFGALLSAKGLAVEADSIGWLNLPEPADPGLPSIVLIGDSTVRNGRGDGEGGQWGWGDALADHFDPAKVNIVNRAIGGLSSRTFRTQGHWERALMLVKPGDWVVMQFGHNDSAPLNDDQRARGTIKGTGGETEVIDNLLTRQPEVVHTYGWYLRQNIREAKAAGATPVVCSLVPRKTWREGRIVRSGVDGYGGWARQVAVEEGVAFIDLNELVAQRYDELGAAAVDALFADPHMHTSRAGAELNAAMVAAELKKRSGAPFAGWAR